MTAVNRRKDRRHPVSIPGTANGSPVLIKDISPGGLAFITDEIKFAISDEVLLELDILGLGGVTIAASVARVKDEGEYGTIFIGLSSDTFKLIEALELRPQSPRLLNVA